MSDFEYDVDGVLEQLENLTQRVPDAIPKAVNAMSNVLIRKLKENAPYDSFKSVIGKTRVKKSRNGVKYQVIFIKNRGENDKNVYKAVVAEYGRKAGKTKDGKTIHYVPARPFWRTTVRDAENEMYEAAKNVMEDVVNKINENRS